MLLATRVALDKIESFRNESFQPEEIQLFLNKSQFRLLDDLINKNFQQGTLRYEWLRPFQAQSTKVTPLWDTDPEVPAYIPYPTELYYLIAVNGLATKSGLAPDNKWDDGCDQPITDPGNIANPITKLVQVDMLETGQTLDRRHNEFYGDNARSPRGMVVNQGVQIFRDEYFIISGVNFDYILEPDEINVGSATDTQWSVSANEKIVDYTVEYMRLSIADPTYQGNVQDFNLRTQNA